MTDVQQGLKLASSPKEEQEVQIDDLLGDSNLPAAIIDSLRDSLNSKEPSAIRAMLSQEEIIGFLFAGAKRKSGPSHGPFQPSLCDTLRHMPLQAVKETGRRDDADKYNASKVSSSDHSNSSTQSRGSGREFFKLAGELGSTSAEIVNSKNRMSDLQAMVSQYEIMGANSSTGAKFKSGPLHRLFQPSQSDEVVNMKFIKALAEFDSRGDGRDLSLVLQEIVDECRAPSFSSSDSSSNQPDYALNQSRGFGQRFLRARWSSIGTDHSILYTYCSILRSDWCGCCLFSAPF
eukprot:jgi/Botrbrau1/5036/Bobra.37_1s0002.1